MTRVTLIIVLILTGASGIHAAPESGLWAYESPDNIEYFEQTPSGDLFVSSKSEIALVSAKTGEVVWSRDDIRDCKTTPSSAVECRYLEKRGSELILLSNTPYALFAPKERVALLDWRTGTTLFDSADHPIGKVREYWYVAQMAQFVLLAEIKKNSYALAAIKAGDSELQWLSETTISKDFEWLGVREDNTALVYGKDRDGKRILTTLNLNTGDVTWQSQDLLKENLKSCCFAPPIYDTEDTTLLFLSKDGPMRLGLGGQLLWIAGDLAGKDPREMAYADGVLFVPVRAKSFPITTDRVTAIDTSDGSVIWEQEIRVGHGGPITIEIHPRGLLIGWAPEKIALLDLQTGEPAWTKEVTMPRGWRSEWLSLSRVPGVQLPIVVGNDAIYFAAQEALTAVNLEDGSLNEIARYEFKDNESPTSLSLTDGDFFLNSSHNFASFDSGGRPLYQRYYKAPGPSKWVKVVATVLEVGMGIYDSVEQVKCARALNTCRVGNQRCQRYVQLVTERRSQKFPFWEWGPDDNEAAWKASAPWYQQLAIVGDEIFRDLLTERYGTTVDAERFSYIYFEEEDRGNDERQFGLVRFDKRTEKEVGRLWLNKRNPEFALDHIWQTVFFKSSEKVIQALKFDTAQKY